MKIMDERTEYSIQENSENISLRGDILFGYSNIVNKFSGKFYNKEGNEVGKLSEPER